ncbi:MAG TPA: TIM barrel protein [Candidatus Baltobacteraceae bacterium]|nr:TIM barrel protein [Candidatus Baltobacteraceae bacterium]
MLREIRDLGFEYAELSHGIRISLVPGILEAVDAGEIKISSLHNFCPLPMGVTQAAPNLYEFSAESDCDLAIRYTRKTLEFASRVKAPLVVLHLGSVELKDYTGKLCGMLKDGGKDSPKYVKLRDEAMKTLAAKKENYFAHTKETLRQILPDAETRGIKLGCENRQALEELPLDDDFKVFLLEFQSRNIVYWHDTGHAQIKENLGLIKHANFLESLTPRLAGFHIHDVIFPERDHAAPGAGSIDFAALKPFVKPEHIKVFEFSPSLPPDAAKTGIAHLKNIWGQQ